MRLGRVTMGGRRLGGIGSGAPASAAPSIPAGSTLLLRQGGITAASGDVASWDSEGSNAMRFVANTTELRPALTTVGSLQGAQCLVAGDALRSESSFTLARPCVVYALFRLDAWTANRFLLWFDSGAYLACATVTGNNLKWEGASGDLDSVTVFAAGNIVALTLKVAIATGTSRMYVNGVEDDTTAGVTFAGTAQTIGLGTRGSDSVNPAGVTWLEMGLWQFADNAALEAFDIDALNTYAAHKRALAGG